MRQAAAGAPISLRDAQLAVARSYGFAGWKDLVREVQLRVGRGLDWAVSEARRVIHDNDVDGLRRLLAEFPVLLTWRADEDDSGLLGMATGSYGDSGDAFAEAHFTRRECAELLLDAGAFVGASVAESVIQSRAKGLIELFAVRGLFPKTPKFLAALGDVDGLRARLDDGPELVNEAFVYACHLRQEEAALLLLDRAIVLDGELGRRVDGGPGRAGFVSYFLENKPDVHSREPFRPWEVFVRQQADHAMRDGEREGFLEVMRREPWLLGEGEVRFQARLVEVAVLNDRGELLDAFFGLEPAILRVAAAPPSQAIAFAFTYVKTHFLPRLLRVWAMPEDLPHAAGNGDMARVARWFDAEGRLALGQIEGHYPLTDANYCKDYVGWFGKRPDGQRVLDTAFAWAVMNNRFAVAEFLLARGADVSTNWCSHEPASILHELVWHKNYEAMQFLIDRGIDRTVRDYRWGATAEGWAAVAAKDEKLAQFLRDATPLAFPKDS